MNDMQAVREAAERLDIGYDNWPECLPQALMDGRKVAGAFLNLTDPTPLTVEGLVEAGGKCVGDDGIRFGDLCFTVCEIEGIIGVMVGKEHLPRKLWPRTVGHLRQLLLRMEGQS